MAISYPLTLPVAPAPRRVVWRPRNAVVTASSPFNLQASAYDWGGKIRAVEIELPPMTVEDAKVWQAFFYKLNGSTGMFYLQDTVGKHGQGILSAAATTNGQQSGNTLVMTGLDGGDNVKAGDWLSMGERLFTVLEDSSESGGALSVTVWPDVDGVPGSISIDYGVLALGRFRLLDWPTFRWAPNFLAAPLVIRAEEEVRFEFPQVVGPLTYIQAIEAAGATPTAEEKAALTTFFANVDVSQWTRLICPVWGVEAANAIDMVDPNYSGVYKNGVTHSPGFVQGDGSTGYFDFNEPVTADSRIVAQSGKIFVYALDYYRADATTRSGDIGAKDASKHFSIVRREAIVNYGAFTDLGVGNFAPYRHPSGSILATTNPHPTLASFAQKRLFYHKPGLGTTYANQDILSDITQQDLVTPPTNNMWAMARNSDGIVEWPTDNRFGMFGYGPKFNDGGVDGTAFALEVENMFKAFNTHRPLMPKCRDYVDAIQAAGATPTDKEILAMNYLFATFSFINEKWGTGIGQLDPFVAVHLLCWGVAAANRINLTDASASASFVGSLTHSAGHSASDGSTGYMDLGVSPSGMGMSTSNASATFFLNAFAAGTHKVVGCNGVDPATSNFFFTRNDAGMEAQHMNTANPMIAASPSRSTGIFTFNRLNTAGRRMRSCGSYVITDAELSQSSVATGTPPTQNVYAFARNNNGTASEFCPSGLQLSFVNVGLGHGSDEWGGFYYMPSIWEMFQGFETHRPSIVTPLA